MNKEYLQLSVLLSFERQFVLKVLILQLLDNAVILSGGSRRAVLILRDMNFLIAVAYVCCDSFINCVF